MYAAFRKILFQLEAEQAHNLTLWMLSVAAGIPPARALLGMLYDGPAIPVTAFGLRFRNPVGLAAGYDKDARAVRGLAALGFGHIEVGTVTPLPQPGNPKPRLFRLPEDEAIINRMGFPSKGSAYMQRRLSPRLRGTWIGQMLKIPGRASPRPDPRSVRLTTDCVLGVNIGRNSSTQNEEAVLDYLALLQNFASLADYLSINVSSPNTVGLRDLQGAAALQALLTQLHAQRLIEQKRIDRALPLLVKLSPDMTDAELDAALDVIGRTHMDGIIVTNTTLARDGLRSASASEKGGLSGAALRTRSEVVLQRVVRRIGSGMAVVSAGGVMTPDDVRRRLDLGATLVQLYTGLVYRGPALVKQTLRALSRDESTR
jgi:dihydroorotate dehydrogenase